MYILTVLNLLSEGKLEEDEDKRFEDLKEYITGKFVRLILFL